MCVCVCVCKQDGGCMCTSPRTPFVGTSLRTVCAGDLIPHSTFVHGVYDDCNYDCQ